MEERAIRIINDSSIIPKGSVSIHISYNESLTLKELSEVFDLTNKAINDVNREKGITNAKIGKEYAAEVTGVDSGSIILHILTNFVAPVALSVLANFLYDRLKSIGSKKDKKEKKQIKDNTAYPIVIIVNGNENLMDINITKPSISDVV